MTENPPPPGGDRPEYPPYPSGSGNHRRPSGPTSGQNGPPSGSQYGQAPGGRRYGRQAASTGHRRRQPVRATAGRYGPAGRQYARRRGTAHRAGGYPPPGYAGAQPYGGGGFAPPPPLLSIGDALSYGWTRFSRNALNWILLLLAILVTFAVVGGLLFAVLLLPSASSSSDSALAVSFFSIGMVVFLLAILALAFLSSVVTTQGGLREIDGAKPAFGDFFRFQNLGGALLAAVLVGVLTWVGSLLCYLPGLIVAFFGMFTVPFAIDRGMNAWTALQSSFSLVSANIGPVFLLYLALAALNWVGSIPLGLGLLVTVPTTTIALMFAFRRLTGGPIARLPTGY